MKTFIINLERRQDRKKHIENFYPKIPILDTEIIKACDGKIPNNNTPEINNLCVWLLQIFKRNKVDIYHSKFGEIGCFTSHLSIWKKIIDKDIDKAVILEDDITNFHDDYEKVLNEINDINVSKYNIIYLYNYGPNEDVKHISEHIISKNYQDHVQGTYGYVITKDTAIFLCNYIKHHYKNTKAIGLDHWFGRILKEKTILFSTIKLVHTPTSYRERVKSDDNNIYSTDIQIDEDFLWNKDSLYQSIMNKVVEKPKTLINVKPSMDFNNLPRKG